MPSTISGPATPRPRIESRTPAVSPCSAASTAARSGSTAMTSTAIIASPATTTSTASSGTLARRSGEGLVVAVGGRSFIRFDREVGGKLDLAAAGELHVDRLVLAVGAEKPDQHRQPAPEADLRLLEDRSPEDDLASAHFVVPTLTLLDAVDEDREGGLGAARQTRPVADRDAALGHLIAGGGHLPPPPIA